MAKELLFDRHRMLLTFGGQAHVVSAQNRKVNLSVGVNAIQVGYDGYDFSVLSVSGGVRINNSVVNVGDILNGAVVIVLQSSGGYPTSITADVSHPEVIL